MIERSSGVQYEAPRLPAEHKAQEYYLHKFNAGAALMLSTAALPAAAAAQELPPPAPPAVVAPAELPAPQNPETELSTLSLPPVGISVTITPENPSVAAPALRAETPAPRIVVKAEAPEVNAEKPRIPHKEEFEALKKIYQEVMTFMRENVKMVVLTTLGAIGAVAGFIGGIRGTIKAASSVRELYQAKKAFYNRQFVDCVPCNMHKFSERNGWLELEVHSISSKPLDDYMPNSYARKLFLGAAKECTDRQDLPTLELEQNLSDPNIPAGTRMLRKAGNMLFGYRYEDVRFNGLARMNKYFVDSFSSLFKHGVMAQAMDLPVTKQNFYLVPIAERVKNGEQNGHAVQLAVISERDFDRFGRPEEVARMVAANPRLAPRIKTLERAYAAYKKYEARHAPESLFPKVAVFLPLHAPADVWRLPGNSIAPVGV